MKCDKKQGDTRWSSQSSQSSPRILRTISTRCDSSFASISGEQPTATPTGEGLGPHARRRHLPSATWLGARDRALEGESPEGSRQSKVRRRPPLAAPPGNPTLPPGSLPRRLSPASPPNRVAVLSRGPTRSPARPPASRQGGVPRHGGPKTSAARLGMKHQDGCGGNEVAALIHSKHLSPSTRSWS